MKAQITIPVVHIQIKCTTSICERIAEKILEVGNENILKEEICAEAEMS